MKTVTKFFIILIACFIIGTFIIDRYTQYLHREQDLQIELKYEQAILEADSAINAVIQIERVEQNSMREIDSLKNQVDIERESGRQDKGRLSEIRRKLRTKEEELSRLSEEEEDILEVLLADLPATAAGSDLYEEDMITMIDSIVYNYIEKDSIITIPVYDTVQIIIVDSLVVTDKRDIRSIKRRYFKEKKKGRNK